MQKLLVILALSTLTPYIYAIGNNNFYQTPKISPIIYKINKNPKQFESFPYGLISGGTIFGNKIYYINNHDKNSILKRDINSSLIVSPDTTSYLLKLKPKATPLFQIGGGYRITEYFSGELVLLGGFTRFKASTNNLPFTTTVNRDIDSISNIKQRTRIFALMAKALFKFPVFNSKFSIYGGPGIGITQVKDKITKTYQREYQGTISSLSKNKYGPALGFFLGANIPLEIGYNISAFAEANLIYLGKYKTNLLNSSINKSQNQYNSLGFLAGIKCGF